MKNKLIRGYSIGIVITIITYIFIFKNIDFYISGYIPTHSEYTLEKIMLVVFAITSGLFTTLMYLIITDIIKTFKEEK